eukprot:scaffold876_cov243-Pinguiococcus_pyrenoidosus.AAC.19
MRTVALMGVLALATLPSAVPFTVFVKSSVGRSTAVDAPHWLHAPAARSVPLRTSSLHMSSMIAPPKTPIRKKRLGGGGNDDGRVFLCGFQNGFCDAVACSLPGLRKLSVEEYQKTLGVWLNDWKKRNNGKEVRCAEYRVKLPGVLRLVWLFAPRRFCGWRFPLLLSAYRLGHRADVELEPPGRGPDQPNARRGLRALRQRPDAQVRARALPQWSSGLPGRGGAPATKDALDAVHRRAPLASQVWQEDEPDDAL